MSFKNILTLSAALIVGCIILALGMSTIRSQHDFVTVKGLSERDVVADQAWWSIHAQHGAHSIEQMQNDIAGIEKNVISFLKSKGFSDDEINVEGLNIYQNNYERAVHSLNADLRISVSTEDIQKVKNASKSIGELLQQGILIQSDKWASGPKYYFTKFQDIKKEMLAEATRAAKEAAEEFATHSGSEVGKIRRANQGVFQILPRNQTQDSEIFSEEKTIRVVSTFDYYLE